MIVGTPREIKNHECSVGLTPASVRELVAAICYPPTPAEALPG